MPLQDLSTRKKIIEKVRHTSGFFGNLKGLMFEKAKNFDYALVFEVAGETRVGTSVHTMFMNFTIDIVFLDAEKRVVDKATLRPWMLNYTPKKAAKYFIELPEGGAKGIMEGNRIEW